MALVHKSKLRVYKELKRGVGLEEYLRYVKGPPSRLFLSSIRVPMGFLRNWVGMLRGVGLRNVLIVGLVRSLLSMFFLSVHHTIPRDKIFWTIRSKFLFPKHLKLLFTAAFSIKLCFV